MVVIATLQRARAGCVGLCGSRGGGEGDVARRISRRVAHHRVRRNDWVVEWGEKILYHLSAHQTIRNTNAIHVHWTGTVGLRMRYPTSPAGCCSTDVRRIDLHPTSVCTVSTMQFDLWSLFVSVTFAEPYPACGIGFNSENSSLIGKSISFDRYMRLLISRKWRRGNAACVR